MEFEKNYNLFINNYEESFFFEKNFLISSIIFKHNRINYNIKNNNYTVSIKNGYKENPFYKRNFIFIRFLKFFKDLQIFPIKLSFYIQKIKFISKKGEEKNDFSHTTVFEMNLKGEKLSFYFSYPSIFEMYKIKNMIEYFLIYKIKIINEIIKNIPLIFGNGCAGVLFHEIVSHPLEGDIFKNSYYRNKIGEKVSNENLTIYDDPTYSGLPIRRKIDDEGEICLKKILIEKGVLKNILCNNAYSKLFLFPAGNGRISMENPIPYPRGTNTILDSIRENNISFDKVYPNFIFIPFVKKASFFPPDKIRVIAGPAFLYLNKKIYGKINYLIIEENIKNLLSSIDFIGGKVENCITFGTCTKMRAKVFVGSASPVVSFLNINYRL